MKYKRKIGIRSLLLGILLTLFFALILGRIFWIQTVNASWLQDRAEAIWEDEVQLKPVRGEILDRNGEKLAYDVPAYTVLATLSPKDSNHVEDPLKTAQALSRVLGADEMDIYRALTRDAYEVELRQGGYKIDAEQAEAVKALELPAIHLREETKRFYPNQDMAAHVLGYIDLDGKPQMGLEQSQDETLKGTAGFYRFTRDRSGIELPGGELAMQEPVDGSQVRLTLDLTVQSFVETVLEKAAEAYHPKRMVAIVTDPASGEVLALANWPDFDPNQYWEIENYRNDAISYPFEPGSTFKIITLAAAVEEGLFNSDEVYQSGQYWPPGSSTPIRDHNGGKGWGEITFLEGVQRSSNVLFSILGAERLGKERLLQYIDAFGFRDKTGIPLPGEQVGYVPSANGYISPRDVAAISFGQAVSVTPIQQVQAVGAIANGGVLIPPRIVQSVEAPAGYEVVQEKPTGRRVISEASALTVSRILESVVKEGSGNTAYIEGYHVAGKTGTAQKFDTQSGALIRGENIVSFIGYAPADDPQVLVYVMVDAPQLQAGYYGSTVAAPMFKEIMQNTLQYLRVPLDRSGE